MCTEPTCDRSCEKLCGIKNPSEYFVAYTYKDESSDESSGESSDEPSGEVVPPNEISKVESVDTKATCKVALDADRESGYGSSSDGEPP